MFSVYILYNLLSEKSVQIYYYQQTKVTMQCEPLPLIFLPPNYTEGYHNVWTTNFESIWGSIFGRLWYSIPLYSFTLFTGVVNQVSSADSPVNFHLWSGIYHHVQISVNCWAVFAPPCRNWHTRSRNWHTRCRNWHTRCRNWHTRTTANLIVTQSRQQPDTMYGADDIVSVGRDHKLGLQIVFLFVC